MLEIGTFSRYILVNQYNENILDPGRMINS